LKISGLTFFKIQKFFPNNPFWSFQNLRKYLPYLYSLIVILTPILAPAAQVSLSWNKSTGSNVIGYKMHYGNYSRNYQYTVDVGNSTSCTIAGLTDGKTYYFAATAYDTQNNESNYSNEVKHVISGVVPKPVGHLDYCRDFGPCGAGEGDCDSDSECADDLICDFVSGTDYCSSAPGECSLPVGHADYCRTSGCGPCDEGEGDCDNDGECAGDLYCDYVRGTDYCRSAGAGGCSLPVGHSDYCRDPACGPCGAGEGDCDSNSECQSGLSCVFVPGMDVCCPHPIGHLDYCRDCGPCRAGQGDCDSDSECQSGLSCAFVDGPDTCQ
jgi:hypothetical protein